MTHYDLVILGTGSGNTILNRHFDDWRVAVVEQETFGGTCLNRGCIPSKMYVVAADRAEQAAGGERFGVHTSYAGVDWPAVRDRVFARIDHNAAAGQRYREEQPGVDVLLGTARFTGPGALTVDLRAGGRADLTADQVVIGVGGRPVVPDVPGLGDVVVHTSDDIMRLEAFPRRLGIVGGGYVGSEFAHVFSALGSQVTQVQSRSRLLTGHDEEVSRQFTAEAAQRWDVRLDASLDRVDPGPGGSIRMTLGDGSSAEVDALLVAVGRRPNTDLLDLDLAGVEVGEDGLVVVDEHQRTTAAGVWALGDISSPEPLKHVANQDARTVQHNLLHPEDLQVSDHRFVPAAVFSSPQVASVGLTEQQARDQGIDLAVARQEYAHVAHGWALMEDRTGHFVKLLADRATGHLVGAHLIGPEASILIQPLIQAMSFGQPVAGLARGQYWIHPALTEVVENALRALEAELRYASTSAAAVIDVPAPAAEGAQDPSRGE